MTDTTFVDQTTVIEADWLNDINDLYYTLFASATTASAARTALGLGALSTLATVDTAQIDADAITTTEIADDAVTLAKLAHITEGDIIYGAASGVPTALAKGTNGHVLTLASGLPSWVANPAKIAQVVSVFDGAVATTTTTMPTDDTIPQNTEGGQFMSLAITPTNASSTLLVFAFGVHASSTGTSSCNGALFRDSTAGAIAAVAYNPGGTSFLFHLDVRAAVSAGSTSATTFKYRAGPNSAGTLTFNGAGGSRSLGGVMASHMIIMEVLP